MDAIRHEIYGIKCDNKSCDFHDDSVRYEDYQDWLNRPCPKCGENLLTEKDLKATQMIMAVSGWLNKIIGPRDPEEKEVSIEIKMDGSGIPTFAERSSQKGGGE